MVFLGQIEGPVCFLLSLQSTRWFVFIARNLLLINPPQKNWKTYCPKYLNLPAFGTHPSPLPQEDTSTKAHRTSIYGGCHKWRDLQNGWFIMKNPMKMDDLGVTPLLETSIFQRIGEKGTSSRKPPGRQIPWEKSMGFCGKEVPFEPIPHHSQKYLVEIAVILPSGYLTVCHGKSPCY